LRRLPILLLLVPACALADEVFLAGAGKLSGRIVEQTETTVTVDVGSGSISVPASRVERIVKGRTPLDEYDERLARLSPQDVDGWRSLGNWASQQGLTSQATRAYNKVIAIAPDDAEARRALGFVKLGGPWVTEEESYPLMGFVQYDGEWMTPAEAELAQQEADAEEARRAAEEEENQAALAQMQAEDQARWDEEAARKEDEEYLEALSEGRVDQAVYWGSWGYGVTYWPSTPGDGNRPVDRPGTRPPSRPVRVPR
jgi:hypothetical protein